MVSAWFPVVLLGYPIFETLFSIYRRQFLRGRSPGRPDALHMHHLIYMRIVRRHAGPEAAQDQARRNSRVAPYILFSLLAYAAFAMVFWHATTLLMIAIAVGSVQYVYFYRRIATWSVPRWLLATNRH
jgi:UDP-N-acetylmuramyl pentapeptide phosphotransferase/UDP-N-acetylglucosamine-1-phosphate transferase